MKILTLPARPARDVSSRVTLTHRICSEFREMPGLVLSPEQAARLFGISPELCSRVLEELIANGALSLTRGGRYTLATRNT